MTTYFVVDEKVAPDFESFDLAAAAAKRMGGSAVVVRLVETRLVEVIPHGAADGKLSGAALRSLIEAYAARRRSPFHYRELLAEIEEAGHVVGGRDPIATFLTQLTRVDGLRRVGGNRSGLYEWRTK